MLKTGQSGESGDCSRLRVRNGGKRDWRKHFWQPLHVDGFSRTIEVSLAWLGSRASQRDIQVFSS